MSYSKIAGAVLLGGLCLAGCATNDYVDKHVAVVQGQVDGLNGQVSGLAGQVRDHDAKLAAHEARLATLDQATRDAVQRAEAANAAAQGKFVYAVVLNDAAAEFKVSNSTLSPEADAKLADLAGKLKSDNKNVYLEIQGYTDATGSPASNLRLGADRAEAVRRSLNKQGVALNRMATISYGQEDPAASNKTRKGRAQNRRVVVVVLE